MSTPIDHGALRGAGWKSWLLVGGLALLPACTFGSGKLPNPKWKPTVSSIEVDVQPTVFVDGGLRFEVLKLVKVDFTKYGVARNPIERGVHLNLELLVSQADGMEGLLKKQLSGVDMQILDDQGQRIEASRPPTITVDHSQSTTGELRANVRIEVDSGKLDREARDLLIGSQRLPL